jgi:hypothetical protein
MLTGEICAVRVGKALLCIDAKIGQGTVSARGEVCYLLLFRESASRMYVYIYAGAYVCTCAINEALFLRCLVSSVQLSGHSH